MGDALENEQTGNAFAGGKEAYDREMYEAIRNAEMSGDDNSSIANADLRINAQFSQAASKRSNDKKANLTIEQAILMQHIQRIIAENNELIIDLTERITNLETALELFLKGEFDPLNNEEHARIIEEEGLSVEEWRVMSLQDQENWIRDSLGDIRDERADLRTENDALHAIVSDPEATTVNDTPVIMELETRLEARGIDIDRQELSNQDQVDMLHEIMLMQAENDRAEQALSDELGVGSQAAAKADDFF